MATNALTDEQSEGGAGGQDGAPSETLLLLARQQDAMRGKYTEHLSRVADILSRIAEMIADRPARNVADRDMDAGADQAILARLDQIVRHFDRMNDLREQADIHHTELLGLLLNGQNGLRTDVAEMKHWVTRLVLRGAPESAPGTSSAAILRDRRAQPVTQTS